MKKILKALLLLMLVLTAAEAAFLVARHTAKPPETGPDKTGTPAEGKKQAGRFLPAGYKITYQAPDDEAGRTVIFDSRTPYSHHNGAGSVPLPDSPDSLSYAVGLLEDWRKIADSDDYELALRDPLAGADLPLFRVPVASTSADRQAVPVKSEDLERLDRGIRSSTALLFVLSKDSISGLWKLVEKGDALVVIPRRAGPEEAARDKTGRIVAGELLVRRFGGAGF